MGQMPCQKLKPNHCFDPQTTTILKFYFHIIEMWHSFTARVSGMDDIT